jgi:LysR family transcriptional activator of glutamate synthase operon
MTTEQLRYFVAVAEHEHLTRAAVEMQVSQPALSRAIRRLEDELGAPLFDRQPRGLEPTFLGRLFLDSARSALAEIDAGRRAIAGALDPGRGKISVAFLHTLGAWLVPEVIGAYRLRRPLVEFRLEQGSAGSMLDQLARGAVDLILTSPRPDRSEIAWSHLITEPLVVAVPVAHRLARRRRVRLSELAEEPFVALRLGFGLRATTDALCLHAGFTPRISFEGEEVSTLRGLVAAGLGVAILPMPYILEDRGVCDLKVIDPDCTRELGIAWNADRYLPPAAAEFRDFVIEDGVAHQAIESGSRPGPPR